MHRFAPWHWLAPTLALLVMAFGSLTHLSEHGQLQQLLARGVERDAQPLIVASALHGHLHDRVANSFYLQAQQLADRHLAAINSSDALHPDCWPGALQEPAMIELRRKWQRILGLIRKGAHSRRIATDPGWHVLGLTLIVDCECYLLLQEQREQAALHVWLDSAAMAADALRTSGDPFQVSWSSNVLSRLTDFWTSERLDRLSDESRHLLRQALSKLEARLPPSIDIERFLYIAAKNVTSPGFYDFYPVGWRQRLSAWKDNFSPQQCVVRKTEAIVRHLPDLVPAERHWPARQQQLAVLRFDPNWHAQVTTWELCHRRAIQELRQLRDTLQSPAGPTIDSLEDLFGITPR